MKKRKRKLPLTHARVIRMSARKRMALSIKDMPRCPGNNACVVGEMRDHYPDGHYESRRQRGSSQ